MRIRKSIFRIDFFDISPILSERKRICKNNFRKNIFPFIFPENRYNPHALLSYFFLMKLIIHFLVTAALVWVVATYGTGLGIALSGENTFVSALIFAVILAIVNLILGGVLRIVTFPLNILTLGLFYFIVTLIVIWVTDYLYEGIKIDGIIAYLIVAVIPTVTGMIVGKK